MYNPFFKLINVISDIAKYCQPRIVRHKQDRNQKNKKKNKRKIGESLVYTCSRPFVGGLGGYKTIFSRGKLPRGKRHYKTPLLLYSSFSILVAPPPGKLAMQDPLSPPAQNLLYSRFSPIADLKKNVNGKPIGIKINVLYTKGLHIPAFIGKLVVAFY